MISFHMPTENNSVKKFKNREHAAELLMTKLNNEIKDENVKDVLFFGIPRGGVILAYAIYKNRSANHFDIVIPRKLGAPNNKELGIGAIMDEDTVYLNEYVVKALRVSPDYIESENYPRFKKLDVELYFTDPTRRNMRSKIR